MDVETNETETAATTAAVGKKHRKRWRFENGTAIVRDVDGTDAPPFAIATLPQETIVRLAFDGMVARLSRAENELEAYSKILAGDFPAAKVSTEKPVNNWRIAIAMARVDAKKKSGAPVTLEEAKAWAVDLDAKVVRAYKTDLNVVKHYNKLNGTPPEAAPPSLAD